MNMNEIQEEYTIELLEKIRDSNKKQTRILYMMAMSLFSIERCLWGHCGDEKTQEKMKDDHREKLDLLQDIYDKT